MNLKRVAITGPESTGKSELTKQLAGYYQTLWVPEVAREYLVNLGRAYVFEDILAIAKEQLELENTIAEKAEKILFCDTDFLVTKIWSSYKYGKCDQWIEEKVKSHIYDLYLLCDIDLPWVEDPLREHPGKREELFGLYLNALQQLNVDFAIISGKSELRLKNAILAVEKTF
ncbi:MAG: ATP-binding protein [Bacteroidales bacterium]|nr:ATP-binding protein [Bacteroidales bacterium]